MYRLRTTYEEQEILDSIPDDIREMIEDSYSGDNIPALESRIEDLESEIEDLKEERDTLHDSLLQVVMSDYVWRNQKGKDSFVMSAAEICNLCQGLVESSIGFGDFVVLGGDVYQVSEMDRGFFTFTRKEEHDL